MYIDLQAHHKCKKHFVKKWGEEYACALKQKVRDCGLAGVVSLHAPTIIICLPTEEVRQARCSSGN